MACEAIWMGNACWKPPSSPGGLVKIFLVTLYLENPLDLLLLASLSPTTVFRFLIPLWPGVNLDYWHSRGRPWAETDGVR